jgi:capsular exopolysaccharide synthesis family protein
LVTSCLPGEGKSTVASLLAASSAAASQRTVLVDGDLRGRTISRNLAKEGPGLGDLLAGSVEMDRVIVNDAALGCCVIPAGAAAEGPSDLLSSRRMNEVIARLKRDFDYIVLDTPPLLSVIDALALAPLADRILLTIDIGRTRQASIAQAFRLLNPQAARIGGMVLNKIPAEQLPKYTFSGYRYY